MISWSGAAVALGLAACSDQMPSTAPITESPVEVPSFAHLRGTVDVGAGTLIFDPLTPSPPSSINGGSGINAAIYGNQGVTVNQHGIYAFSAPEQRYWYWPERLSAAGGGSDTTALRKTWTFEADTQVTTFQFDVLVSAAWPPPNDTRWKVDYRADSVPNTGTEPSWVRSAVGSVTTQQNTPSVGMITISAPWNTNLTYFRIDSLNTTTNAYIEARFRVNNPLFSAPEVSFGIDDQIKFIAAGVNGSQAGFLTGSLTFQTGQVNVSTTALHTYQMRKYRADSAVLYIDGVRRIGKPYSALPARLVGSAHGFYFGPLGSGNPARSGFFGNSSTWDHVIYEIGASQP